MLDVMESCKTNLGGSFCSVGVVESGKVETFLQFGGMDPLVHILLYFSSDNSPVYL